MGHRIVSVIIPFLNPGPFLREAIESVIAQTYPDWELLLVDDGTADGSTRIARSYSEELPGKIFYLRHAGGQNHGVSASRNLGIRNARGGYLAFLDADDVWMPEKLERQIQLISAHPEAAMVYGPALNWRSWTGKAEDQDKDFVQDTGFSAAEIVSPPRLVEAYLRQHHIVPSASAVLVRKQAAVAVGGFVDEFRCALYDDTVFYTKLGFRECVLVAGDGHYKYRLHHASGSRAAHRSALAREVKAQYFAWLRLYMTDNNIKNGAVEIIATEELRRTTSATAYRALLRKFAGAVLPRNLRRSLRLRLANFRAHNL